MTRAAQSSGARRSERGCERAAVARRARRAFAPLGGGANNARVVTRSRAADVRALAVTERARGRGFTLVELMTVVVIMGVLAMVGLVSVRKHMSASKSIEALNMIQSIRAAQERWRAEHMIYFDVTGPEGSWYPADPSADPGKARSFYFATDDDHPDAADWRLLRPTVNGPVRYGYRTIAGLPGASVPEPEGDVAVTWPTPTDNWYVVEAIGDADADGTPSFFLASSFDDAVRSVNESE